MITPMKSSVGELVARRDLLYMITWREIRVKYKQSVMGMLWAILMPAVIVSAGVVVRYGFSLIARVPLAVGDIAAVSVRAVPWAFFISSIRFATASLIANNNLVTKIALPREVLKAMGDKGREWVARDFSWDRTAHDMLDVYLWLSRGAKPPPMIRFD